MLSTVKSHLVPLGDTFDIPRPPRLKQSIRIEFRAPLSFVYRQCTEYRPWDPGETDGRFERRILARSPNHITYEDLWWKPDGWRWRRAEVELHPPDRWCVVSIGNYRWARTTFRLVELPNRRTRLELQMVHQPGVRGSEQPSRQTLGRTLKRTWGKISESVETDYRRSRDRLDPPVSPSRSRRATL
jgi:hypothetical protein